MNLEGNPGGASPVAGLAKLGRLYRHMGRATEVASVLVKFGFGDLLVRLGLSELLEHVRGLVGMKPAEPNLTRPERVRLAMEELGVVFIKWGQYLSTREDIIPESYIKEFTKLQDSVSPVPFEDIEKLLADIVDSGELVDVNPEPLAAASVGQVHEARLSNGQVVVVKVRRPGLRKKVTTDLEILGELASLVENHLPALASIRPQEMAEEFSRSLNVELDYTMEALNLERFGRFYAGSSKVVVPRIYRSLCSQRVLVMEKLDGIKFNNVELLSKNGYDLEALANFGAEVVFEQIMVFGYFHGDPHPGNLLVQPGPKIALLDMGLVGRLDRPTRDLLLDLTLGVIRRKPKAVTKCLLKLVNQDSEYLPDRERLEMEIDLFLEANLGRSLKEVNIAKVLSDVMSLAAQYRLSLPPDLLLLVKALIQVEGLGYQLNPNFDLLKVVRPFFIERYRQRYSPKFWLRYFGENLLDLKEFVTNLPEDLKPLYTTIRSGRIKSDFHLEGLEGFRQTVERASYRLSFSLVLASLVVGSSVVIHSNIPPTWYGLPVLGILGFLGAGVVGFWLLYDYIKNRRF